MFRSCLICTNFTDGLQRFIGCVPDLAKSGLEKIIFFHSVPVWEEGEVPRIDEEKMAQARARLAPARQKVPLGVEVIIEVVSGKPLDTIPRILEKHPVDVILTGTSIHSLLEEKFFGSTTKGLARCTEIPLMIFRPQLLITYTIEELSLRCQHLWRYLLIPYSEGKAGNYLIEKIKQYAKNRPANSLEKCLLISVVEESGRARNMIPYRLKEAEAKLREIQQELVDLGLETQIKVTQGNPFQEILAAALDFDISAIAIANDYRSSLLEWTVPSLAENIMRNSWFPVLFFSPKK
ncbi:MAG: universal stress protein [Cyanobacteria bacterium J083]|nr:MAG: universal stress protein [Cyanobacteria bacterium J083]